MKTTKGKLTLGAKTMNVASETNPSVVSDTEKRKEILSKMAKVRAARQKGGGRDKPALKKLNTRYSPLVAVRRFCFECCGGNREGVKYCGAVTCDLWVYRFGRRPLKGDELMVKYNFTEGGKFWPYVTGDKTNGQD